MNYESPFLKAYLTSYDRLIKLTKTKKRFTQTETIILTCHTLRLLKKLISQKNLPSELSNTAYNTLLIAKVLDSKITTNSFMNNKTYAILDLRKLLLEFANISIEDNKSPLKR